MKNSILFIPALAAFLVGALILSVDAGVSSSSIKKPSACSGCATSACVCTSICACGADGYDYFAYAPSGVMGDHIHHKGGLMASYRYMFMSMQRNYDGDSQISDADARDDYMGSAAEMDMQMHMLGVMYAPSDKLTLMLMSAYKESSMLNNMMGTTSKMRSSGWGDVTFSGFYSLYRAQANSAHFGLGVSAPTGSIDQRMSNGARMGYPMQLGSGTWDMKPSLTWIGQSGDWSYGSQVSAVIHLDENDNGYTLGDSAMLTSWINRRINDWSAVSIRLTGKSWGNVDGRDDEMPTIQMGPMMGQPMAAAVDPDARAGSSLDLSLGLSLWDTETGARFAIEAGAPIYQNLDGPQLGTEWFLSAGIQMAW
ncbi:MAG: transporter [Akkermansiaceae bacterium]|nr:transporter [Akkermansiaceae bacterium]